MRPVATADIETENWTTFVVGAIHYSDGHTDLYRHDREEDMARDLLAIEGEVWAHNGGRFDWLWLLDHIGKREVDVMTNGTNIISLRVKGSRAIFLDSMRVFPFSLAILSGGAKRSLADLCSEDHTDGENCGGYCAIKRGMTPAIRDRVEEYLVADVVELMSALDHFVGLASDYGFEIKRTVGATAWAWASDYCGIEPHTWTRSLWAATREGYHGARSEVLRRTSRAGHICDVNSMYPWALTQPLPVGRPELSAGRGALRAFVDEDPGVYQCSVEVPEQWLPPLPLEVDRGSGLPPGIAFPWGRFTGTWPLPEIQHAEEKCGVTVTAVHRAVTFNRHEVVFDAWVREAFGLRMKFGKQSREGIWAKFLMNSLTGKTGTRCESHRTKVWPDERDLALCVCCTDRKGYRHSCTCGAWRPMDGLGKVWEQTLAMRDPEPCAHPEWAAYLTGYARIKCLTQLVADGQEDAVYTDTDSCWSETIRTGLSHELGEWDDDGKYKDFEALGPKSYHALVESKGKIAEKLALKGIPHKHAQRKWAEIKDGQPQKFGTMRGLKRARGGAFFVRDDTYRTVTANTGRRIILSEDDPKTYPPCIDDTDEDYD
jgi:hypothetical protein